MIKYYFLYSDKTVRYAYFDNRKDAEWYAHMEGDHLVDWGEANENV